MPESNTAKTDIFKKEPNDKVFYISSKHKKLDGIILIVRSNLEQTNLHIGKVQVSGDVCNIKIPTL